METEPVQQLLRRLRAEKGKSLRTAAHDLGIDPGYLSRLERGEKTPSDDVQRRAAKYYEIPVEDLQLSIGEVPEDVAKILKENPEAIEWLRNKYGSQ